MNAGCVTTLDVSAGTVTCKCPTSVGVYIGAFKAAVVYAIEVQSQFTTTQGPTKSTLSSPTTTTTTQAAVIKTPAQFSFEGDYDTIVNGMGGEVNARDQICTSVRYTLQLKTSEFQNCTISKGSVVVSFDIVQIAAKTTQTEDLLAQTVANDGFTITTLDGTALHTQTGSTVINGNSPTDGEEAHEKDDGKMVIIIIAVVVAVVFIIVIAAVIAVVCQTKKNQQVHHSEKVRFCFF